MSGRPAVLDLSNAVILDTETTGLDDVAEIIEISIIDAQTGSVLIDTLIRPVHPVQEGARSVHRITDEMLANAPAWPAIQDQVAAIPTTRTVIIYNAGFDLRMLRQTAAHHGLELIDHVGHRCAMEWYSHFFGAWNDYHESYTWQKLAYAAQDMGVEVVGAHRSLADCMTTLGVICAVNAELSEGKNGNLSTN